MTVTMSVQSFRIIAKFNSLIVAIKTEHQSFPDNPSLQCTNPKKSSLISLLLLTYRMTKDNCSSSHMLHLQELNMNLISATIVSEINRPQQVINLFWVVLDVKICTNTLLTISYISSSLKPDTLLLKNDTSN